MTMLFIIGIILSCLSQRKLIKLKWVIVYKMFIFSIMHKLPN